MLVSPRKAAFGSSFSPEPILHHSVPTGPPARARVITLEDQRRLSHVEFRQESAILKRKGIQDWVSCLFLQPLQTRVRPRAEIPHSVQTGQRTPRWGRAPTSPKPASDLNFCSGFALRRQWHTRRYHPQLTNSKRPSRFLLPGITLRTTKRNILQCCAKKNPVCIIIILILQRWRGEADARSVSGIEPKLPDYKASTPKFCEPHYLPK